MFVLYFSRNSTYNFKRGFKKKKKGDINAVLDTGRIFREIHVSLNIDRRSNDSHLNC